MQRPTFRIYWQGETPLITLTGENHCGVLKSNRFHYEVTLAGDTLNARGFIADNADIGRWFDSINTTDLSCERLCESAARAFLALDADIIRAHVRIWGIRDQAYAEVDIERAAISPLLPISETQQRINAAYAQQQRTPGSLWL